MSHLGPSGWGEGQVCPLIPAVLGDKRTRSVRKEQQVQPQPGVQVENILQMQNFFYFFYFRVFLAMLLHESFGMPYYVPLSSFLKNLDEGNFQLSASSAARWIQVEKDRNVSRRHFSALYPATSGAAPFLPRRRVLLGLGHRGTDPSNLLERKRRLPEGGLPPADHFRFRPHRANPLSAQASDGSLAGSFVYMRSGFMGVVWRGCGPQKPGQDLFRGPARPAVGGRGGRLPGGTTLKLWPRGPLPLKWCLRIDPGIPRTMNLFPNYNYSRPTGS